MSALDYTNAWYGSVDKDGTMDLQSPGSQNWSSESRGDGLTKVTIRGWADYQPSVLLTVMSNDLTSYGGGAVVFINVTDMGKDGDGNWYFGVATRREDGLKAQAFSFVALATNSNNQ